MKLTKTKLKRMIKEEILKEVSAEDAEAAMGAMPSARSDRTAVVNMVTYLHRHQPLSHFEQSSLTQEVLDKFPALEGKWHAQAYGARDPNTPEFEVFRKALEFIRNWMPRHEQAGEI